VTTHHGAVLCRKVESERVDKQQCREHQSYTENYHRLETTDPAEPHHQDTRRSTSPRTEIGVGNHQPRRFVPRACYDQTLLPPQSMGRQKKDEKRGRFNKFISAEMPNSNTKSRQQQEVMTSTDGKLEIPKPYRRIAKKPGQRTRPRGTRAYSKAQRNANKPY